MASSAGKRQVPRVVYSDNVVSEVSASSIDESTPGPDYSDPQSPSDLAYNEGGHIFQFDELNDFVCDHTQTFKTREEVPFNDLPSRAAHNTLHRAVFEQIRQQVATKGKIPNALFDPPRSYIQVHFADWPRPQGNCGFCPCDLPDDLPMIEIRAPKEEKHGITKDLFLSRVSEALYGQMAGEGQTQVTGETAGLSTMTNEVAYLVGNENSRPVVELFIAKIQATFDYEPDQKPGDRIMGHIYAMVRGL